MASTREKLMSLNVVEAKQPTNKVSVVGVGQVGMACAFSMLVQVVEDKLKGELLDLRHGLPYLKNVKIEADTNLSVTKGSKIIVICAGLRQRPGESRLSLVQRNTEIYRSMIPTLVQHSPNAIFLVVSNPVDILTYVTWKLSGLPPNRVIGSGTNLDSARFRYYISEKLNIASRSVHGWIIGEHGDSSVPIWSGVSVAGVRLCDLNPKIGKEDDDEKWNDIHKQVVQSAYEIINLKGYTSWAIGLSVSTICNSILRNEKQIYACSTLVSDWNCAEKLDIKDKKVFISVPCMVGSEGVESVVSQTLNDDESKKLKDSVNILAQIQNDIKF